MRTHQGEAGLPQAFEAIQEERFVLESDLLGAEHPIARLGDWFSE
jgi:hypothetical protein